MCNYLILTHLAPGSMQPNVPRATRVLLSRGEGANKPGNSPSVSQSSEGKVMQPQRGLLGESCRSVQDHGPQKQHAGVTGVGDWNPHSQQVQNVDNGATDKAVSGIGSRLSNDQSMSARDVGGSRTSKVEKERRKKNYDPNVFFKVNGKLYQKLGKIGSGGSSEVHKVISAECIIYALKKVKLKGRDYPTAYGFCQEIEYLNKLKGKGNIIQLIDYEVPSC